MSSDEVSHGATRPSNFIGKSSDCAAKTKGISNNVMEINEFDDDLRLSEIKPRKMSRFGGQNNELPNDFDNELEDSWV